MLEVAPCVVWAILVKVFLSFVGRQTKRRDVIPHSFGMPILVGKGGNLSLRFLFAFFVEHDHSRSTSIVEIR